MRVLSIRYDAGRSASKRGKEVTLKVRALSRLHAGKDPK